ncbi:MAG: glycosyltransferase family 4 protein [Nitrospirae bacterium]|nr:glycosyltransferase family 4 protein [Nitrospirota bacterium]
MLTKHFNFRNGTSRVIYEVSTRLAARGHEVHIFCNRQPSSYADGPVLHHLSVLPLGSWARVWSFNAGCSFRMRRGRFDIVHGHENTTEQDVVTVHNFRTAHLIARGLPLSRWDPHLWIERRQFGSRRLKRVITLSEMVKRDAHRHFGIPLDRIVVIPSGVDTARFHPGLRPAHRVRVRREMGLSDDELAVLFVASGNFIKRGLLNLFSSVQRRPLPRLKIVIIGGDRLDPYRTRAQEMGIGDRILFLPFAPRIEELHAGADGLIFPSYYETFGIVPLEAMASGLPVLVTAQCGVSELITDGRDGLILKHSEDIEGMAVALAALEDPAVRERMGRAARATAERHTWDAAAEKTMQVYEAIRTERDG